MDNAPGAKRLLEEAHAEVGRAAAMSHTMSGEIALVHATSALALATMADVQQRIGNL